MISEHSYEKSLDAIQELLINNPKKVTLKDHIELHLEVPNSMIAVRTLSEIADGIQDVTDGVFHGIDGDEDESIVVYMRPPKKGCFELQFVLITSPIVINLIYSIAGKNFLNEFSRNLIGKGIDELFKEIGASTGEAVKQSSFAIHYVSTLISIYLNRKESEIIQEPKKEFKKEREKIRSGKNKIYRSLKNDNAVSSISFDGFKKIQGSEFVNYMDEDLQIETTVNTVPYYYHGEVKVISPVSLSEKSRRKWTGLLTSIGNNKETVFTIEDDNFIHYLISNGVKPAVDDLMEVQMIKRTYDHPQWNVLRVLKHQGQVVSEPLNEIDKLNIGILPLSNSTEDQGRLI